MVDAAVLLADADVAAALLTELTAVDARAMVHDAAEVAGLLPDAAKEAAAGAVDVPAAELETGAVAATPPQAASNRSDPPREPTACRA
mgnify:CR=1 FL=1